MGASLCTIKNSQKDGSSDISRDDTIVQGIKPEHEVLLISKTIGVAFHDLDFVIKHSHDLRKRNVSFNHSRQHCAQEIGNEYHPGLYLDGIHALAIEKVQGKILFQLFVEGFYSPSALVDFSQFLNREFTDLRELLLHSSTHHASCLTFSFSKRICLSR